MASNYKIREARIEVRPGVTVVAEVDSAADVASLLSHLASEGLIEGEAVKRKVKKEPGDEDKSSGQEKDDPAARVERRADLGPDTLKTANILAFKDEVPQLLRPNTFGKVTDATLALLFAIEAGLGRSATDFEAFKALYDAQNIKSGSPLSMLLTNLRKVGYLDRKAYAADRSLRLTAKGEKRAIEVLKSMTSAK